MTVLIPIVLQIILICLLLEWLNKSKDPSGALQMISLNIGSFIIWVGYSIYTLYIYEHNIPSM